FLCQAREMGFRRVFAALSFAVRFSPENGPFAVVLFGLCRCPCPFVIAGFVPAAADLFDPADSGFAAAAAVVVVAAADPSDLSADPSVVAAAGLGSVGSAAYLVSSVCPFAVASAKGMAVVAVPFCFLAHRSSF